MSDLGPDLSWFRPTEAPRADGNNRGVVLGSYRESCEGLNVRNPQPGRHYRWVNLRSENDVQRRTMQGFTFVRPEDPEYEGYENYTVTKGSPQASMLTYGQLALAWCPIERLREIREHRSNLIRDRIMGPTRSFQERGRAMYEGLRELNLHSESGHAYYERSDHGLEIRESEPEGAR